MKKLLIVFILIFTSCKQENSKKLTIATAANMQFVMADLIETFNEQTGIECETIISSSGKLTAQITEGAPFDIMVSADMKYPLELFKNGFTTSKPKVYAYGKLVLWSMNEDIDPSIEILTKSNITHIALANPKTAPYGLASINVLKHYHIFDSIQHKLVYGENISQTNQFIISKAAEIGFTSKSVVMASITKGKWMEIDSTFYAPIAQGIALLNNNNNHSKEAQLFYDFLFSDHGKEILNKFGYSVPE